MHMLIYVNLVRDATLRTNARDSIVRLLHYTSMQVNLLWGWQCTC